MQSLGILFAFLNGCVFPGVGFLYTKLLFALFKPHDELMHDVKLYCVLMVVLSAGAFLFGFMQKYLFGIIGENIIKSVRLLMYRNVTRRHIGWFDLPDHNPGSITSILAGEVQQLNGVSSEAIGTNVQVLMGLVFALVLAFFYSWRITLVSLGATPLLVFGNAMNAKMQGGAEYVDEASFTEANKIVSDAVINAKTVASFGNEERVVDAYAARLNENRLTAVKKAHVAGLVFGFSQFV